MHQRTITRLRALLAHVSKLVAVAALDLARLGAILRAMALTATVAAETTVTATTGWAIPGEVTH